MKLSLASAITLGVLQDPVDADHLLAARVFVLGARRCHGHFDLGRLLVVFAGAHLSDGVILHATFTLDQMQVGPDLPVDFLPRDTIGFSDESNELLKIPIAVDNVLGAALAVMVNKACALATAQHLALLLSEELVAVGTLVQVVLIFLK